MLRTRECTVSASGAEQISGPFERGRHLRQVDRHNARSLFPLE